MRQIGEARPGSFARARNAVAVMFPGQGSQFTGMAGPWLSDPVSSAVFDVASSQLGFDLAEACNDENALARTDTVQLGVFVCDVAAFRVLESAGVRPVAVAGHSLGEFAALVAAGVLEFPAALEAVQQRAEAMVEASAAIPGAMTALMGLSPVEAADVCAVAGRGDVLTVANENSPKQTVLSGTVAAIERAEALARTRGARPIRLRVAGAFHSPLMAPALPGLRSALARLEFRTPSCAVVPNVSGRSTMRPAAIRDLLSRHLLSPVRWERSMASLAGLGVTRLIEAGPGDTLAKLAKRCVPGLDVVSAGTPEEALAAAGAPATVVA